MLNEGLMYLEVLGAGVENWQAAVREMIAARRNFFVVLPPGPEAVREFCELFGLGVNCRPKLVSRADFLRVSQHVSGEGYDQVMRALNQRQQVIFLEQLDFPFNHPPRVRPLIVYCPVLGIVSDHTDPGEAAKALASYNSSNHPLRPKAEAVIYRWDEEKWVLEE